MGKNRLRVFTPAADTGINTLPVAFSGEVEWMPISLNRSQAVGLPNPRVGAVDEARREEPVRILARPRPPDADEDAGGGTGPPGGSTEQRSL